MCAGFTFSGMRFRLAPESRFLQGLYSRLMSLDKQRPVSQIKVPPLERVIDVYCASDESSASRRR
jgi:hypothetical protein